LILFKSNPSLFPPVRRQTYWIGIATLMAVFIGLSIWAGLYFTQRPEEHADQRIQSNDPLALFLYSPVGNAVVMLLGQYLLANVVFWPVVSLGQKIGGKRG